MATSPLPFALNPLALSQHVGENEDCLRSFEGDSRHDS
jgi:hypothetical protein